ncbi:hypothetical protein ZWY2020_026753 [Hordeum vulgare]|nr:hypothetical protein ZWY2020_026753 [Hordeum vulgare]
MGVGCCCSCSMLETALQLEELLDAGLGSIEPTVAKRRGGRSDRLADVAKGLRSWIEARLGRMVLPHGLRWLAASGIRIGGEVSRRIAVQHKVASVPPK